MTQTHARHTLLCRLISAFLVALLLSGLPETALHANEGSALQPFRAEYSIENDIVTAGRATLSLTPNENGNYDFVLQSKPTGILKWSKNGKIREHAVLSSLNSPFESSAYRYTDKGRPERSYHINLDRQAGMLELTRGDDTSKHELLTGAFDRLSVTLELLHQVNSNSDFELFQVQVLDGHIAEAVSYSNQGTEQLQTGLGEFTANRILKDSAGSNREILIWVARVGASKVVLPLKIEQYKNGKLKLRLKISKFTAVD